MVSSVLINHIQKNLEEVIHQPISSITFSPVSGGSISQTFKIFINNKFHFFCKINAAKKFPLLFEKEKNGFDFLRSQNIFRIPQIVFINEFEEKQLLIIEWVDEEIKNEKFWETFGEKLEQLHSITHTHFGFDEDNFMGALFQSNRKTKNWIDFFINERIEPQMKIAINNNLLDAKHTDKFENLFKKLPAIFGQENPSLIHGDLWNGNFLCGKNNNPVLIDPAIYFGNRNMDIAMTKLFGGFDNAFYRSYYYHFPKEKNADEQYDICNLYPLLIHLNLFGKSYLPEIIYTINNY